MTLEQLKQKSVNEEDGTANFKLKDGKWLEVMYRHQRFYYYYGVANISEVTANEILRDCQ